MKTFMFIFFAATSLLLGSGADARSIMRSERATLTQLHLDPNLYLEEEVGFANLLVNYSTGRVRIDLMSKLVGGDSKLPWLQVPSHLVRSIELPIVATNSDQCGSKYIIAREDKRPVDGMLEEVVIMDNRTRLCEDARFGTEVTYKTQTDMWQVVKTTSYLYGDILGK